MIEARRADGSPTPSPKDSVSDLFRYLAFHAEGRRKRHDFLDAKDARFHDFRKTHMKELAFQGIGLSVKQADPLTRGRALEQEFPRTAILKKLHNHSILL